MEYNPIAKKYEDDILSGQQMAGKLLKLAIKRQRKDLKEGHKRGLYFDHEEGQRYIDFFEILNLTPELPFKLMPFNLWEIYVFYGWRRSDGTRRFRTQYKSCARKNAKTPVVSGEIIAHLLIENIYRAEAYVSATKEDQAKIAFDDAKAIIANSPELEGLLNSSATSIFNPETSSKFQFLTSNPKTADGTRPSFVVIDEYHEFDSDAMLTKLRTGQIHQKEPIFKIVTTRGSHKEWPCYQTERKVFIPILEGSVENDSIFVVIYSQDSEDEFDQPETWIKSNPMLCDGGILTLKNLVEERDKAKLMGEEAIVGFKTLNLNWWCDAPQVFIPEEVWIKSGSRFTAESLESRPCWAGLDMGATDDFCAFSLYFPPEDWHDYEEYDLQEFDERKSLFVRSPIRVPGDHYFLWWFWIPEAKNEQRISNGLHSLRDWRQNKLIAIEPGSVIDPRIIENDIKDLLPRFDIKRLSFDRYNAVSTALSVQEAGVPTVVFPQDMSTFNGPTKAFRDLTMQGRLNHNHNPIAQWMMRNAVPIVDTKGNIMLTKDRKRSVDKIDGIVASIMAMGGWMMDRDAASSRSQYENEGLFVF